MDKIEMLQKLIDKSEDEKEIKELKQQQMDEIRAREREKATEEAKAEFEKQKEEIEQEKKSIEDRMEELKRNLKVSGGEFSDDAEVNVTEAESYKGYNLKRAKAAFQERAEKNGKAASLARMKENPERFEGLIKTFTDLVSNAHTKDQLGGTDNIGGYLVPDDQRTELLAYARNQSVALRRGRVIQMNSDVMTMPREDAKVNLSLSDESTSMSEGSATFDEITLTAKDLDGYADVSIHLEQDAQNPGGIVGVLLDQFVESYGQKIDSAVFAGASVASGVFDAAGRSSVTSSTAVDALAVSDLLSTIGKLERPRRSGAAWYGSRTAFWEYIRAIQENSQSVLVFGSAMNFNGTPSPTILGYPVEEVEEAPDPADGSSNPIVVFGNLDGYLIGDRLNDLTLFRDPYSKRTQKRITYSFLTRVAFSMALPNNFVVLQTAA